MPARSPKADQEFVRLFVSAYDDFPWNDVDIKWLDQEYEGAVEARATRKSDGMTLAIEHTLIEPFVGDKSDAAFQVLYCCKDRRKNGHRKRRAAGLTAATTKV